MSKSLETGLTPSRKPCRRDRHQERRLEQARTIEQFVRITREEMTSMLAALEVIVDELRAE
jgi:hypothetical protein